MGEIRFVGTGETRGYPNLVCKKNISFANTSIYPWLLSVMIISVPAVPDKIMICCPKSKITWRKRQTSIFWELVLQ